MIIKQTVFKIENMEIIDSSMSKVAGVGIPADETYDPDFLYLRVRAVSAGEYYGDNKNGDWFPEKELKNTYTTFLSGHVFKNHENKDPANAIGEVLDAEWDDEMKCVCLVIKIDRKIAPSIVRAIEKGYMTDVSMGCRVPYSICSICGNKARNPKEYCDHIKMLRRKILPDGKKVFEINIQPKFHDISVVLSGAEKVAKVTNILDETASEKNAKITPIEKVASDITHSFEKAASFNGMINDAIELPRYDKIVSKTAAEKTAAFEKRLKGLIVNEAKNNLIRKADTSRHILKAIFTPYWDDKIIKTINLKLKALAIQKNKPLAVVFHEFIHVLNFAGIELSPREFTMLSDGVFDTDKTFKPFDGGIISAVKKVERCCDNYDTEGISLSQALGGHKNILNSMPVNKIRIVIRKASPISSSDDIHKDIMENIVSKFIGTRSVHQEPLIKRIRIIKPISVNKDFGEGSVLSNLLYSLYQKERTEDMASGYTPFGMRKFASYFESTTSFKDAIAEAGMQKEAGYGKYKAAVLGTPVIYGYSKLQQARMKNKAEQGEDTVNPVNRVFAEYPEAVAGLNILFGPKIYKEVKSAAQEIKKGAKPVIDNIKNKAKLVKKASVYEPIARMYSEENFDAADNFIDKLGLTRADFAYATAEKVAEAEAELMMELQKNASEINEIQDDFYATLGVSTLIMKKLKNLY